MARSSNWGHLKECQSRSTAPAGLESGSIGRMDHETQMTRKPTRAPEGDAALYLHPATLARLKSFELRAKMIVEGIMSGQHRSPYQGFSVEFAQHRPYVAGDDVRHLDWKVFGRTDKLYLKQYQQETTLDLIVMVDSSGSMNYGSRAFAEASGTGQLRSPRGDLNWTKFDHATALAAALSYITLHQGDRAGLVVYADAIRAMVNRSSAMGTWRQVVGALSTHPVDQETNIGRAIDQTLAKITNRCLIAIISDFYTDPEQIRAAFARVRHRGHDLIAFQIVDRDEAEFNFTQTTPFLGLEGEPMLRVDPRALRSAYLEAFNSHAEKVEKTAQGFGFDFQRVNTHDWLGPPLSVFIARRLAQMKKGKYG